MGLRYGQMEKTWRKKWKKDNLSFLDFEPKFECKEITSLDLILAKESLEIFLK